MIARNNFRICLYKLILLKNIIDTKIHKEKMQTLFAFEQLIINTEDRNGETNEDLNFIDGSHSQNEIARALAEEDDPFMREQL